MSLVRLLRAEKLADGETRREIAAARDYLEGVVGPTVRPADAARAFGVTQPALLRWLDNGEVATVLTPEGRRELPLPELVGLLDEVDAARQAGYQRPLSRVLRERIRMAESIDPDRLLPRPRGHRIAERQALAYHRVVSQRLNAAMVDRARRRLRRWVERRQIDPRWADEWEEILDLPTAELARVLSADTARARELRQTSPFAGLLTTQERKRIRDVVESRG